MKYIYVSIKHLLILIYIFYFLFFYSFFLYFNNKGEAFIELKTKEDAEKILEKKLPFNETEINIMKKYYFIIFI